MSNHEFHHAGWRKSSGSNANGDCVQVAQTSALVRVRDSKHPAGPVLAVAPVGWSALLAGIRRDEFG